MKRGLYYTMLTISLLQSETAIRDHYKRIFFSFQMQHQAKWDPFILHLILAIKL